MIKTTSKLENKWSSIHKNALKNTDFLSAEIFTNHADQGFSHSHSIVAGGLVVTSYTTLLMDFTSFTILFETSARVS